MGDSTCMIQSFEHSSLQQGDPAIRALMESVSFGRFVTETLEWDKWSTFNQNRYLEEAKRFSKPGLVAQKKALFEAQFKKIAADRAAAALRKVEASKPCIDSELVKFVGRCSADAAQNSLEADGSSVLDISSQSGKAYCGDRNDSPAEVSDLVCVNNSDDPVNSVQMDEPSSDLAVGTTEDLEPCGKMEALNDTSKFNHMVVEPISFQKFDPPDGVKTSTMLLDDLQNKNAAHFIQEPGDQFVVASDGKCKPIRRCSKTLDSVTKHAVASNLIPRPPAFPKKENNTIRNTRHFESAMLNKKMVTTKPHYMSVNLESSHLDFKRPLASKNLNNTKSYADSVSLQGSRAGLSSDAMERPGSGQVSTNIGSHRKQDSLSTIRKSSAELYIRPESSQLKKDKTLMQRVTASVRNTVQMRKSKPKSLHVSINLDSHVGEKEKLVSLSKTGTKIDSTVRMSTTHSVHAPANQVNSDRMMRRKQIIPVSNSSADVRKLITQFHAKSAPPLYKDKHSEAVLTLSQVDKKKSVPKLLHMSVELSSTVRKPTVTQISGNYRINASNTRASRDGAIQGSLRESIQTVNGRKETEKCPPHKMDRPDIPRNLIRPPSPTVCTLFRFRSDERAAKCKEILEEKCKVKFENSLERKGKFPLSRPQSPYARKPIPGKARDTKNCKQITSSY